MKNIFYKKRGTISLTNNDDIHRASLFVFYDKDGILDRYVENIMDSLKASSDVLLVASNGLLTSESEKKINQYADFLIKRGNTGFDFGAWKQLWNVLCVEYDIQSFDEIIYANDTFIGPLYPIETVYRNMNERSCDFWGVTRFGATVQNDILYPPFLQTYFFAVRKNMFESTEFNEFWEMIENTNDFSIVQGYEKEFSKFFLEKGFVMDTYIDTSDIEVPEKLVEYQRDYNHSFDKFSLLELLKRGFPFLKKKNFFWDVRTVTLGNDLAEAVHYAVEHYDYDDELVYEHILRIRDLKEIEKSMCLKYIVNTNSQIPNEKYKNLIIMYITENTVSLFMKYIFENENLNYFLIVDTSKTARVIKNNILDLNNIQIFIKRKRPLSLLQKYRDVISNYDYVAYIKDVSFYRLQPIEQEHIQKVLLENTITSLQYMYGVMDVFNSNLRLGILHPFCNVFSNSKYVNRKKVESLDMNAFWIRGSLFADFIKKYDKTLTIKFKNSEIDSASLHLVALLRSYIKDEIKLSGSILSQKMATLCINNNED